MSLLLCDILGRGLPPAMHHVVARPGPDSSEGANSTITILIRIAETVAWDVDEGVFHLDAVTAEGAVGVEANLNLGAAIVGCEGRTALVVLARRVSMLVCFLVPMVVVAVAVACAMSVSIAIVAAGINRLTHAIIHVSAVSLIATVAQISAMAMHPPALALRRIINARGQWEAVEETEPDNACRHQLWRVDG